MAVGALKIQERFRTALRGLAKRIQAQKPGKRPAVGEIM
jgi:hypothetical protein